MSNRCVAAGTTETIPVAKADWACKIAFGQTPSEATGVDRICKPPSEFTWVPVLK